MCAAAPVAAAFGYAIPSPAVAASAHSAAVAALPELAEARISNRLLQLARDIRRPRTYVGHSAFICFALCRGCRPFIWEGASRVDIVKAYVPWASGRCKHECIVDGVCCCFEHVAGSAVAEMKPVSETHPLSRCTHFVAAVRMACGLGGPYPDSLVGFYSSHGSAVLGTVADGDFGRDVRCQMSGLPQTATQRNALREEIGDYLMARVDGPWMHGVMVSCQEISAEDVENARAGKDSFSALAAVAAAVASPPAVAGAPAAPPASAAVAASPPAPPLPPPPPLPPYVGALEAPPPLPPPEEPPPECPAPIPSAAAAETPGVIASSAVAGPHAAPEHAVADADLIHKAIAWASNVKDHGLIVSIVDRLPDAVKQEQVRLYQASTDMLAKAAVAATDKPEPLIVYPHLLSSRMQVAEAFHRYLRANGWVEGARLPRNSAPTFVEKMVKWHAGTTKRGLPPRVLVVRWHKAWLCRSGGDKAAKCKKSRRSSGREVIPFKRRLKARKDQGKPVHCPWMRQELCGWFARMRYSIDWKAVAKREGRKCVARFTRSMLRSKVK